jgi:hypothetical protein
VSIYNSLVSANGFSQDLGVIWPTHITERPESDFKRKLMKVLMKPFNQEEYDELFAMATDRTPVIKERRTRRRVMYYPWKHEMGKSYFDSYPGMLVYHAHIILVSGPCQGRPALG